MFPMFIATLVFAVITMLLMPTQKAKAGTIDDFDFPRIDDGSPVYYVAGRVLIKSANLLWYGDFKSKAIKKKAGLFKKSTVGHRYYLGWQLALCLGPNVKLRKVWFGTDEPGFDLTARTLTATAPSQADIELRAASFGLIGLILGAITRNQMQNNYYQNGSLTSFRMIDDDAFGGETGSGGYDLFVNFYSGSSTQIADPYLVQKINGRVPGYRGLAYMVMHGYIGNSTSLQAVKLEAERIPDPLGLGAHAVIGTEGDANPANVLYEMLTNNFGALSINPAKLNVASFVNGGHVFFNEDEGISIAWGGSAQAIKNAFQDVLRQVDATMYEDPLDGQIYLKLIREDYDINNLPRLSGSNIMEMSSYAINLWSDTKNKVRTSFDDRQKDYEDRVAVAEDMANIAFQNDQVKAVNTEHRGIKRADHANRKAAVELNLYSTPLAKVRLTSTRFDLNIRPGTPLVIDYPEYNIANLVVRATKVDLGDPISNRLLLDLVGDKFAQAEAIYAAPGVPTDNRPSLRAANITYARVLEAPRFLTAMAEQVVDAEAPRLLSLPQRGNSAQLTYSFFVKKTAESVFSEIVSNTAYPAYGALQVAYPLSYAYDTATGLELASLDDPDELETATPDQVAQGRNLILVDDEIMGFETYELNPSGRFVLKGIRRGLLDTVPAAHAAGAKVIWLGAEHVGAQEYVASDALQGVLASIAPRGAQDMTTGVAMAVVPGALG